MSRPLSKQFNEAMVYAHTLHREQPRKGKDIPYIGHLLGVTSMVLEAGGSEEAAIAALLHDAVEDQGGRPRLEDIEARFGPTVAHIVEGCTDSDAINPDDKLPWCDRKQKYIAHIERAANADVRLVSIADKVHNARAILLDHYEEHDAVFQRFKGRKNGTLWYYRALVQAFRAAEQRAGGTDASCRGRHRLIEELDRIVSELEQRAGGPGANPCQA